MPSNPTPLILNFIIPNGQENNFIWEQAPYSINPVQMIDGNWAAPYAVMNTPGLPQEFKDSLLNLNNLTEVNCCNFKVCNHGG